MKVFSYIVPSLLIILLIYAIIKRIKIYDVFVSGIKQAFPLIVELFPYFCAILIMTNLMQQSGLSERLIALSTPFMNFFGIPKEIIPLIMLKPFSGSGSLALLNNIYNTYGADSYISRCASVVFGSSETVFYVAAVYFAKCKQKKLGLAITISLISIFISTVFACLICKIM